jgi:hypothetical protein
MAAVDVSRAFGLDAAHVGSFRALGYLAVFLAVAIAATVSAHIHVSGTHRWRRSESIDPCLSLVRREPSEAASADHTSFPHDAIFALSV